MKKRRSKSKLKFNRQDNLFSLKKKTFFAISAVIIFSIFFFTAPFLKKTIQTVSAADLSSIIPAAETASKTINLNPGIYDVNTDFDVPKNITLHFQEGAVISIANGATLTISGPIDDTTNKIFDDQNSDNSKGVKFGPGAYTFARPEWWGAKNDNNPASAPANVAAIEKAMWSYKMPSGQVSSNTQAATVKLRPGVYFIDKPIILRRDFFLGGEGNSKNEAEAATLKLKDGSNCNMLENEATDQWNNVTVSNLRLVGGSQTAPSRGYQITRIGNTGQRYKKINIRDCFFTGFNDYAILNQGEFIGENWIENNLIEKSKNGMRLNMGDAFARNNTVSVYGDYGIYLDLFGQPFEGNDISGAKTCLYTKGTENANISRNRIHDCKYGIRTGQGSVLTYNTIENNSSDGIYIGGTPSNDYNFSRDPMVSHNTIRNNGGFGINFDGTAPVGGGFISSNDFSGNASGAINFNRNTFTGTGPFGFRNFIQIEKNSGIDTDGLSSSLESVSNPSAAKSSEWKTANSSPVTLRDFVNASPGKDFNLSFGDSNTTVDFMKDYGPELVNHGSFDSAEGWTISGSWSYDASNQVMHNTGASGGGWMYRFDLGADQGAYYEVSFTIKDYISGAVAPYLGVYGDAGTELQAKGNGRYSQVIKNSTTMYSKKLGFWADSFNGSIDDISLKKVDSNIKGNGGVEKKFSAGETMHCTKGTDYYWYCEQ